MQKLLFIVAAVSLVSFACKRQAFVEHKVKLEKADTGCDHLQNYFRMTSNYGGERYEFQKCLPADFSDKQVHSERRGDTVLVNFGNAGSAGKTAFRVTLDIDTYPAYTFLTIDGDTYTIVPTNK